MIAHHNQYQYANELQDKKWLKGQIFLHVFTSIKIVYKGDLILKAVSEILKCYALR